MAQTGTPGLSASARAHYEGMARQMCEDQRAYFVERCSEDPTFLRGECFVVEPFTDARNWRMTRALGQRIQMHG